MRAGGKNGTSNDHQVIDVIHHSLMSYIHEQPSTWAPILSHVSRKRMPLTCNVVTAPFEDLDMLTWLAVWCSGNALVSINAVALHRARLVLGWVTASFGQVNCLIT